MAKASARHILVKTKEEAETIKKQLAEGKDFALLAKKHSLCKSSAKKGGDLGEFGPGKMVKAFDNVVFKKPVLKVHGPVKTQFGFHLIETIYRS
jgi:peptidyl-prolyl cis-trans isomerase C